MCIISGKRIDFHGFLKGSFFSLNRVGLFFVCIFSTNSESGVGSIVDAQWRLEWITVFCLSQFAFFSRNYVAIVQSLSVIELTTKTYST